MCDEPDESDQDDGALKMAARRKAKKGIGTDYCDHLVSVDVAELRLS